MMKNVFYDESRCQIAKWLLNIECWWTCNLLPQPESNQMILTIFPNICKRYHLQESSIQH